jgi:hypothetical protein
MTDAQVNALITADPIVLDLTGAGIHTTTAAQGVNFDINGTGTSQQVAWTTGSTEGFLVLPTSSGGVTSGAEMFGTGMLMPNGQHAANGYEALGQYDTNHDGVINASDAVFSQLQVWVDTNSDGKVEAGELETLSQLGITSLSLQTTASNTAENGSSIGLTSTYTTASGATHEMADVNLTKSDTTTSTTTTTTATTPSLGDLLAAPATDLLPGHAEPAAKTAVVDPGSAHAQTTQLHGLVDNSLLDAEERNRNQPLI